MSTMQLWIGRDPDRFDAGAGTFLAGSVECNRIATVLEGVQSGRFGDGIFAVAGDASGQTVGVALRTPPRSLMAAGVIAEPDAFIAAWLGIDPELPGVAGEPELARALAAAWAAQTGGSTEAEGGEALYVLDRVVAPQRPASGQLRPAHWRESAQLGEWALGFARDAHLSRAAGVRAGVEHALTEGRLYVWEDDGRTVAMAGHSQPVTGIARIGPVYTPPQLRGRGYASVTTAALSQLLLDRGVRRCMLYAELANPVSNHIYAKIGYVRRGEWEEHHFLDA